MSGPTTPPYGSPQSPAAPPVGPGDDSAPPPGSVPAEGDPVATPSWSGTESWARYGGAGWSRPQPVIDAAEPPPEVAAARERELDRRAVLIAGGVGAGVAAVVAGFIVLLALALDDDSPSTSVVEAAPAPGAVDVGAVLDRVGASVVTIRTGEVTPGVLIDPDADAVPDTGAGSGVVLEADGLVLTNEHVIAGADQITVLLSDGRELRADFVGSVPDEDVALIRIRDVDGLVPAQLGSSVDVAVGDPVVAIGNAFNLAGAPSVTSGIVSAKGRTIESGDVRLQGLIQTDAAINQGNSGGPLVDTDGAVIGINTAIVRVSQNVGFALSIDRVAEVVEQIRDGDAVVRAQGFLGVSVLDVDNLDEDLVAQFAVTAERGAFVAEIVPGTAADQSELQRGDVIVAIDGSGVDGRDDVSELIARRQAGETVQLEVLRGDQRQVIEAELGARGTG
ncbi:MAG: trypsin-like peptidase domain-containing protein [Actinomycetota bacterium]